MGAYIPRFAAKVNSQLSSQKLGRLEFINQRFTWLACEVAGMQMRQILLFEIPPTGPSPRWALILQSLGIRAFQH